MQSISSNIKPIQDARLTYPSILILSKQHFEKLLVVATYHKLRESPINNGENSIVPKMAKSRLMIFMGFNEHNRPVHIRQIFKSTLILLSRFISQNHQTKFEFCATFSIVVYGLNWFWFEFELVLYI